MEIIYSGYFIILRKYGEYKGQWGVEEERLSSMRRTWPSRRREDIPEATWWTIAIAIALCTLFPEGLFSKPSEDREWRSPEYVRKVKTLFISFQGQTAGVL